MGKIYTDVDVYTATQERLDYIFSEFDNIYISFSGGKDSGVLLNLALEYAAKYHPNKKIALFHQDFEAQYQKTTEYVERVFEKYKDAVELYWICLPMASKTSLSNFETEWYTWDDEKQDVWVRPMPTADYVINMDNNPFDFYKYKMPQDDVYKQFGRWYKNKCGGGKTIGLIGVRADESLHRYSGIVNKKHRHDGKSWITKGHKDVWSASPLYDWTTEDIWVANGKFGWDYNEIYDLYHKAGLSIPQMRVASPFNEWASESLNLYRVLEPQTWTKLLGRVKGANFVNIYGGSKALAHKDITLPDGHSWKSYTEFLLSTLPKEIRENYIDRFETSIKFWGNTGGGMSDEVIKELKEMGYRIELNGVSNFTKDKKSRIIFKQDIPDDTDDIRSTTDLPSWKRMCICILKNDHMCRHMGFGPNKEQREKIKAIKSKYKSILTGGMKNV